MTIDSTSILVFVILLLSLLLFVIAVGSFFTTKMIAEATKQNGRSRSDDELFIGQAAAAEIRLKDEALKEVREENKRMREVMTRYGISPETGQTNFIIKGNPARARMYQNMVDSLSEDEVRRVCFLMNIDSELFDDSTKGRLVESLLQEVERAGRQPELFYELVASRPEVEWMLEW